MIRHTDGLEDFISMYPVSQAPASYVLLPSAQWHSYGVHMLGSDTRAAQLCCSGERRASRLGRGALVLRRRRRGRRGAAQRARRAAGLHLEPRLLQQLAVARQRGLIPLCLRAVGPP